MNTEGNKIISEFMGLHVPQSEKYNEHWIYPTGKSPYSFADSTVDPSKLKYHSDWNWLMPVCKHIIDMYADNRYDIFDGLHHCDIDETYQAVVKFIEFWNDPNSKIMRWRNVDFPYNPMPKGKISPL